MAGEQQGAFLRGIERIFNQGSLTGLSEGQLLRRFAEGDEGAFESLVTRHGPMVRGVCRRSLDDASDVEDAFQATFLVLLRKAAGLRDPEALSPWLYGVAFRVAAEIRARAFRRSARERKGGARLPVVPPDTNLEQIELRTIIDEEIGRLPERYRRPVVLCYLEGRTHEEAARKLRCSAGSVRGRLDRARQKLKDRLTRRGVAPAAGLAALAAGAEVASAAVPAPLVAATVATLTRAATATAITGTASTAALELADGVFRAMIVAKLKVAVSFMAAAAIMLAMGTAWLIVLGGSFARGGRDITANVEPQAAGPAEGPQVLDGDRGGSTVDFRVVDQRTGKPLPGVALTLAVERNPRETTTTDDAGRSEFTVPTPLPTFLSVVARKQGYVMVRVWLLSPSFNEVEMPAKYLLNMPAAESIGGVVRDQQDRPVAGVRVAPTIWTNSSDLRTRDEFDDPAPATTDAQGRWRCIGLPAGIKSSRVSIAFTHPDYQHVNWPAGQALAELRRGQQTILPRGLELAGRIIDPAGRPIPGANVMRGSDRFGGDVPRALSDEDGRFRFTHVPGGETMLTVQARGYAPALEKAIVRPGLPPIQFRLEKGRAMQGRVVDVRGEPLAGATIYVDGWRGYRTLEMEITTDEDGEFRWTDAPPDSVWIDVACAGYFRASHREVPPAGGDLTIAMTRQVKVRGTVVDAETRHAVKEFTLVPGMERGATFSPYWDRSRARRATGGRYEIRFDDVTWPDRRLRVEADGFMPAVSRVIRDDDDSPVVNFVLHKAAGIASVVKLPDGTPLAGAEVVLVSPSQPAFLTNGRAPEGNDHRIVWTGADGRFTFPPQEPPYTIVVLHLDRGFAEQTIRNAGALLPAELKVRPWGRVEGTLRIGRRPGAGQRLTLSYDRMGDTPATIPWWSGEATTDDAGRFAFDRVMPGEVTIARAILIKQMPSSQTWGQSQTTHVEVSPDTTARVDIGGTGRPVIGKVTAPAGLAGPVDWTFSSNNLIPKVSPIQAALLRSGLKKAHRLASGGYTVKLEADGSFRVDDVKAGAYDFLIRVNEPPRDPFKVGLGQEVLATARLEVVVPPMPGGRSDEPLDLGAIPGTAVKQPELAPAARKP